MIFEQQHQNMIRKQEIQRELQSKKLTSTSDLIMFIVDHVSKISYKEPIQQIVVRLEELQKPKGLDNIMLEEVKTIVQAMLDHRQEGIMDNVQSRIDNKLTHMDKLLENKLSNFLQNKLSNFLQNKLQTKFQQFMLLQSQSQQSSQRQNNNRQSLRELNSMQLYNTDSITLLDNFYKPNNNNTSSQPLYSKSNFNSTTTLASKTLSNRNSTHKLYPTIHGYNYNQQHTNNIMPSSSSKQLFTDSTSKPNTKSTSYNQQQQLILNNQSSLTQKLKQTLYTQNKQIQDLKHSIIQIQSSISQKLNIKEIHQILSTFQTQIIQNIQTDKIHLQNLQFVMKKQLHSQIINFKKQIFNQLISKEEISKSLDQLNKDISLMKKGEQKRVNKYDKLKSSVKQLSQNVKNINVSQISIEKNVKSQKVEFQNYCQLNNSKNQDLANLLQHINQKIQYLDKIDMIEENITQIESKISMSQFQTQLKTKNDQLVWEKQLHNFNPKLFKFQPHKSQIVIIGQGFYQIEFVLRGLKSVQELTGLLQITSAGLDFGKKELKTIGNQNVLRFFVQIQEKSLIALKILYSNEKIEPRQGLKGIIKISRF